MTVAVPGKIWFAIFDAVTPYAHGQDEAEELTNRVVRALLEVDALKGVKRDD